MKYLPKKNIDELLRDRFEDNFKDHFPISSILPINMGGVGYMFVEANTTADLVDAAKIAIDNKIPYVVIGAGTAIIVGESGFPGLVIRNITKNLFRVSGSSRVVCDSGMENSEIIIAMASAGLGGLEFLYPIPGTIGGAIISNAELGDRNIHSYVKEISIFSPDEGKIVSIDRSTIKNIAAQIVSGSLIFPPIVLTATLQFARLAQDEIIRRLSIIKQNYHHLTGRSLGYVFSQKLSKLNFDRVSRKQLKALNVSYDKELDRFYLKRACTPEQLKGAIKIVLKSANDFGIEISEKITYLGYYQGEDDE